MSGSADELLARTRGEKLLEADRRVIVMYSGGRDSTCLLDLAQRICGPKLVRALHVNHGLRPAAGEDERHCVAVCERLGVALEIHGAQPPTAGNVQAWARETRYAAARELAAREGADVAAGHTASDQVETILYRLASAPSRRAVLGMRPRDGHLVRPLLTTTREETTAYCTERGLPWREDEANASLAYARARVRTQLLPALRGIHPAAERNVLALAEVLREEAGVLDALVAEALGGESEIARDRLRELPGALQRLVVQRLADAAAGGPAAGVARRTPEILEMPDPGALDLPHGVRAVLEGGRLRLVRTPPLKRGRRTTGRSPARPLRINP